MKAILMSIRPQHLVNILNGKKTIELRKRFPSDFRGWVYLYCTKAKPYLCRFFGRHFTTFYLESEVQDDILVKNGLVVARVWVYNIEETITINWDTQTQTLSEFELSVRSCVSIKDLNNDFVDSKAIDISKLEIFDKPKELGEFYYYKKRLIDCGMDCPPYFDEVKTQVRKAPQSWQYIYIEEEKL